MTAQVTALLPNPPLTLNIPAVSAAVFGGLDPAPGQPKGTSSGCPSSSSSMLHPPTHPPTHRFHIPSELKVRYGTGAAHAVMEKKAAEGAALTIGVAPPPTPVQLLKPRVGGTPAFYVPSRMHSEQPIEWESKEGKLFANGERFHLKGVNWFGGETNTRYPHGA